MSCTPIVVCSVLIGCTALVVCTALPGCGLKMKFHIAVHKRKQTIINIKRINLRACYCDIYNDVFINNMLDQHIYSVL